MEYASHAVGTAGLTTGIIGTGLGALNAMGGLAGLFGGARTCGAAVCSENMPVNRYELNQVQEIADLKSQIALRDANTYGDQKLIETYKYIDGQLKEIRDTLCAQAVHNQRTEDSFVLARQDISAVK